LSRSISVVIGVYNAEPYLAEAVESVLMQDYRPLELIVVDDGGDLPSTTRVIERHSRSLGGRAKLLPQDVRGDV